MAASASEKARRAWLTAPVVAGFLLSASGCTTTHHAVPSAAEDRRAADAFLAAWRRSLVTTWAVDSTFERQVGTKKLAYEIRMAQRPPDRVRVAGDTVDARVGGQAFACGTGADGQLACRSTPATPYDADVNSQVATLAGYFRAPHPLYRARVQAGGCFGLELLQNILAPPYGRTALFCFDAKTGAPVRTEIRRTGSTDVTSATSVRAQPTQAELAPPTTTGR